MKDLQDETQNCSSRANPQKFEDAESTGRTIIDLTGNNKAKKLNRAMHTYLVDKGIIDKGNSEL